MRLHSSTLLLLAMLAAPPFARAQDWKGTGRIHGVVTTEDGKPIVGATVAADCPERGGGTTLKTDKKGRWALAGVVACSWDLDFEAEGYEAKRITVRLSSESVRLPSVEISLTKSGPPPELMAAAEKADAAYKAGRFDEARAEYEKLLELRPDLAPTVHQQIGFTYVQQKQYQKAVEYLEKVLALDPANAQIRAIAAQAALEGGMMERARQLLTELDETGITNADIFFNMGVNFFNASDVPAAIEYFGKAIERDAAHVDAHYRRALAYLGQGKTPEAKADFEKVVALQPDGEMAKMSQKALEQLK